MQPEPSWGSYAKDISESVARRIELRLLVVLLLPLAKTCKVQVCHTWCRSAQLPMPLCVQMWCAGRGVYVG